MTLSSIQAAVDAHLQTHVTSSPIDVAWEGTVYEPTNKTPYLSTQFAARTRRAVGAGEKGTVEWSGIYQISAFYPAGRGMGAVNSRVDALLAHFKRGTTLVTADSWRVICEAPEPPPALKDPSWVMVPVLVRWFAYEQPV